MHALQAWGGLLPPVLIGVCRLAFLGKGSDLMQGLTNLNLQDILALLTPRSPWDYLLYIFLFFTLMTLFMQRAGQQTITILLVIVAVGVFVDKVKVLGNCGLEVMLIRVLYFVVPLIVAGLTKNPKSRVPAVIAAVLGLAYTFGTWFFVLQGPSCPRESRDTIVFLPVAARALRLGGRRLRVDLARLGVAESLPR